MQRDIPVDWAEQRRAFGVLQVSRNDLLDDTLSASVSEDAVSRAAASRWVSAELGPGEKAPNYAVQPPIWASVQPAD
jgi:hypothetical protein